MLDARIAQGARSFAPDSPQDSMMRALQLISAQRQNALQQMQMQAYGEDRQAKQTAQKNALMGDQTLKNYLGAVDPSAGPAMPFSLPRALALGMPVEQAKAMEAQMNPAPKFGSASPGSAIWDERTGKVVSSVPFKPESEKMPEALRTLAAIHGEGTPQFLQAARALAQKMTTHQPATNVTLGAPVPVQLPDGSTGYVQPGNRPGSTPQPMVGPDGKPMIRPTEDKPLTESQAKATTFLGQMRSASQTLGRIGADQTVLSNQAEASLAGGPANIVIRERAQQVRQAQDQWSEAYLRFKTGAAATEGEVALNRRTFFPVIGDKPAQVKQKQDARLQAERDMEISAGRGAGQLTTPRGESAKSDSDPLGLRGK